MCVQYRQLYDLCGHVAYDYNIQDCKRAAHGQLCVFQVAKIPEVIWAGTTYEGRCDFCELEDEDAKEAKRRKKRAARRLDLFEEFVTNKIDSTDTSKEIDQNDGVNHKAD